jgi:hypothetical protein
MTFSGILFLAPAAFVIGLARMRRYTTRAPGQDRQATCGSGDGYEHLEKVGLAVEAQDPDAGLS